MPHEPTSGTPPRRPAGDGADPGLTVVIPAYNEARRIAAPLGRVAAYLVEHGVKIYGLSPRRLSLEELFVRVMEETS